jgi:hypothetical protein
MMGELHAQGRSADDIRECIRSAPLDAHVLSAIRTASALGYMRTAATMDGCMPIDVFLVSRPVVALLDLDGGRCVLQV